MFTSQDAAQQDIQHSIVDGHKTLPLWETENRTSLHITLSETHGILNKTLNILT